MRELWKKYKHGVPALVYGAIYLFWFTLLENRGRTNYMVVHMNIDDYIPFCEVFVIPYFLWFAYVPAVLLYLFFKDKKGYWRNAAVLGTGMTVFLLASTFIPNIHHLRLYQMPRDNIFTDMVRMLWRIDTPTNLFPSIHVFNSLAAHFAVLNNETLSRNKWVRYGSLILCVSVILSTMFIKQHSVFDVLTAFVMGATLYALVYSWDILTVLKYRLHYRGKKRARLG